MIATRTALALGLLLVPAVGCRLVDQRAEPNVPVIPPVERTSFETNDRPPRDPAVGRAGFTSEVTTEQRVNTHIDLARALEAQGRADDAVAEYQQAVEAVGDLRKIRGDAATRARLHRRVASALDRVGKFDEASSHYQEAQRLAPRDADVWNDAGYSLYLQGRHSEADGLLRKAASIDAANPRILTNLGLNLAASGRADEAMEILTKAAGPAAAHANLAYVLAAQGNLAAARAHYHSALAIDPELKPARQALAQVETRLRASLRTAQ